MPTAAGSTRPDAKRSMPAAPAEQLRCFIHHFLSHVLAMNSPTTGGTG